MSKLDSYSSRSLTVAAFEKLLYEKLSYQRIWKMSRKQIKHNFHTKITLRMCHLIKQLMTFHFGGHWFINPLEVMFTSAVGFGEHDFFGIDKSQCSPYEKSLIVYYYMTSDNVFSDWLMSLVTFFDKTL
jgi:hypothetical protein